MVYYEESVLIWIQIHSYKLSVIPWGKSSDSYWFGT